jgi:membrane-bound ClpP family serine protease
MDNQELMETLTRMVWETPNDSELGEKVRSLVDNNKPKNKTVEHQGRTPQQVEDSEKISVLSMVVTAGLILVLLVMGVYGINQ